MDQADLKRQDEFCRELGWPTELEWDSSVPLLPGLEAPETKASGGNDGTSAHVYPFKPCNEFLNFCDLPTELRLQIWEAALPRRIILTSSTKCCHRDDSSGCYLCTNPAGRQFPAALTLACHESRNVVYHHGVRCRDLSGRFYFFDHRTDTILVNDWPDFDGLHFLTAPAHLDSIVWKAIAHPEAVTVMLASHLGAYVRMPWLIYMAGMPRGVSLGVCAGEAYIFLSEEEFENIPFPDLRELSETRQLLIDVSDHRKLERCNWLVDMLDYKLSYDFTYWGYRPPESRKHTHKYIETMKVDIGQEWLLGVSAADDEDDEPGFYDHGYFIPDAPGDESFEDDSSEEGSVDVDVEYDPNDPENPQNKEKLAMLPQWSGASIYIRVMPPLTASARRRMIDDRQAHPNAAAQ